MNPHDPKVLALSGQLAQELGQEEYKISRQLFDYSRHNPTRWAALKALINRMVAQGRVVKLNTGRVTFTIYKGQKK